MSLSNFSPELIQLVVGALLGIIGWNIRKIMSQLDSLSSQQTKNSMRLVRIETRLGIIDNGEETNGG